jgi:hypothetical protein
VVIAVGRLVAIVVSGASPAWRAAVGSVSSQAKGSPPWQARESSAARC